MGVYYVLLRLSQLWLSLSFIFRHWANAIRNVWLIGANLYNWLIDVSNNLVELTLEWNTFANEWLHFVQSIPQAFSLPAILNQLVAWVDDIISLVRYFDDWVTYAISRRYPQLSAFLVNPSAYVVGLIISSTGLDVNFLNNPRGAVLAIVSQALGSVSAFLANPFGFVIGAITQAFPLGIHFLQDPDGYLTTRLQSLLPDLSMFLQDPDDYILTRIQYAVDNRVDAVSAIAQAIATKIISYIW